VLNALTPACDVCEQLVDIGCSLGRCLQEEQPILCMSEPQNVQASLGVSTRCPPLCMCPCIPCLLWCYASCRTQPQSAGQCGAPTLPPQSCHALSTSPTACQSQVPGHSSAFKNLRPVSQYCCSHSRSLTDCYGRKLPSPSLLLTCCICRCLLCGDCTLGFKVCLVACTGAT
jgi:hypothetical protein